jgi:NAD(P)-dependent dehydrogenase (short-subunit alcohol dehydrogenase family)
MRLHDKAAIVTGSRSGSGEDIAMRFAGEGAKVMINDRRPLRAGGRCHPGGRPDRGFRPRRYRGRCI